MQLLTVHVALDFVSVNLLETLQRINIFVVVYICMYMTSKKDLVMYLEMLLAEIGVASYKL